MYKRQAQEKFATYTQEQVDKIFLAAATAANQMRIPLAKQAVAETGMGVVEDLSLIHILEKLAAEQGRGDDLTLYRNVEELAPQPVSYTHLDVYKRQDRWRSLRR